MARTGDRFVMPDGSAYIVRRSTAETAGAYVEMDFVLPARCVPPPPHVHPSQVEEYRVLEGELDVVIEGVWTTLRTGASASVPVGALHTFRNRSGRTVRVANRHTPAVGFEVFIERTHGTLRAAGIRRPRDPRIALLLSMVMLQHRDTLAPGRRREDLPMRALARLARLLPAPAPPSRQPAAAGSPTSTPWRASHGER